MTPECHFHLSSDFRECVRVCVCERLRERERTENSPAVAPANALKLPFKRNSSNIKRHLFFLLVANETLLLVLEKYEFRNWND